MADSTVELPPIVPGTPEVFQELRDRLVDMEGFELKYDKKGIKVWGKFDPKNPIKVSRVAGVINASVDCVFDVLLDEAYRWTWDTLMAKGSADLYALDGCGDVGYYAVKLPAPLKDRDFVNVRYWNWSEDDTEGIVISKSVALPDKPPTKKYVRGHNFFTGFRLIPDGENKEKTLVEYISQSDPRGSIPKFIINLLSTSTAPKSMQALQKACDKYVAWKEKNEPDYLPWRNLEQRKYPPLPAEWLNVAKSEEMPETEEVDPAEEEAAMLAAQEANGSLSDSEPATPASQEEDAKGAAQTASV